jgi:hypothetical protein
LGTKGHCERSANPALGCVFAPARFSHPTGFRRRIDAWARFEMNLFQVAQVADFHFAIQLENAEKSEVF